MKRILFIVLVVSMVCTQVACNKTESADEVNKQSQNSVYSQRYNEIVGDSDRIFYVAKEESSKRDAIYDERKTKLYTAREKFQLSLFKVSGSKIYFMEYNFKKNFEVKYYVLDLDNNSVNEFCKIPSGGTIIDPMIYNGKIYYQNLNFEYSTYSNSLISFNLNEGDSENIPTLVDKNSWPSIYPDDELSSNELTWEENRAVWVIGIVDDTIYYTYDSEYDLHPNKVDEPNCNVVAACDLDGSNKRVVIDSSLVGEEITRLETVSVRVENDKIYFFAELNGRSWYLYRMDIGSGKVDKIPVNDATTFVLGEDSIFVEKIKDKTYENIIYKVDKDTLTAELLFSEDVATPLYATKNYLYFQKFVEVEGKKVLEDKIGRIKVDGTGMEMLE